LGGTRGVRARRFQADQGGRDVAPEATGEAVAADRVREGHGWKHRHAVAFGEALDGVQQRAVLGPVADVADRQHAQRPGEGALAPRGIEHVEELRQLGHLLGLGDDGDDQVVRLPQRRQAAVQGRRRVDQDPAGVAGARHASVRRQSEPPGEDAIGPAKERGDVPQALLGVEVHERDGATGAGEPTARVQGRDGLAHPALAIGEHDRGHVVASIGQAVAHQRRTTYQSRHGCPGRDRAATPPAEAIRSAWSSCAFVLAAPR
jgi:hypothetical protein